MPKGGARAGAGRKKKEVKAKPISKVVFFRLENALYDEFEAKAKEENLTAGQYARKIILEHINK